MIDLCLEFVLVNGFLFLRDFGVCGVYGICENVGVGKFRCKCDKEYIGNYCYLSKCVCKEMYVKVVCRWLYLFFCFDVKIDFDVKMIFFVRNWLL